jgi:hypothetical protein
MDPVEAIGLVPGSVALFSSETDATDKGQIICGGLSLTKLRTVSWSGIIPSADDPVALAQIVNYFHVDPSTFRFDVYQHLTSGATIVVPAGARIRSSGSGCAASFDRGQTSLQFATSALASATDAQRKSVEYEISLAGDNPQSWVADPQFTYVAPDTRFDGLIVRRRSYVHIVQSPFGQPRQDRYRFETLAVRGTTFIGSSALNTADWASLIQHFARCSLNPSAPECAAIMASARTWAQAVLAVALTTFPVG